MAAKISVAFDFSHEASTVWTDGSSRKFRNLSKMEQQFYLSLRCLARFLSEQLNPESRVSDRRGIDLYDTWGSMKKREDTPPPKEVCSTFSVPFEAKKGGAEAKGKTGSYRSNWETRLVFKQEPVAVTRSQRNLGQESLRTLAPPSISQPVPSP